MNRGGLDPMWQAGVGVNLPVYRERRRAAVAEAEARGRAAAAPGRVGAGPVALPHAGARGAAARCRAPGAALHRRAHPPGAALVRVGDRQLPGRARAVPDRARGVVEPLLGPRRLHRAAGRARADPRGARGGQPRGDERPAARGRGRDGRGLRRLDGRRAGRGVRRDSRARSCRELRHVGWASEEANHERSRTPAWRSRSRRRWRRLFDRGLPPRWRHRRRRRRQAAVPLPDAPDVRLGPAGPVPDLQDGPGADRAGAAAAGAAPAGRRKVLYYRSPMDPGVHSPIPRKDEMGMDYVPVYEDETSGPIVSGRAMVALSPERRQLLGVRSEPVTRRKLERTIRSAGRVALDERRVHHVHTKYEAYVEKLYVNFVGQYVRKGDHLAALYSPELVATQQEYLLALRAQQRLQASGIPSVAQRRRRPARGRAPAAAVLGHARRGHREARAHRQGAAHRRPSRRGLGLRDPEGGHPRHARDARPTSCSTSPTSPRSGSWPTSTSPTSPLRQPRAWPARRRCPTIPAAAGAALSPTWTRSSTPRRGRSRCGSRCRTRTPRSSPTCSRTWCCAATSARRSSCPRARCSKTGDRRLVFLDLGDGRLEPREVTTGERVEGGYAVLSGLAEGDRVVTSANFLIDSESSLKAALVGDGHAAPAASAQPRARRSRRTRPRAERRPGRRPCRRGRP